MALYFTILAPEFERVFGKEIVEFWLVLYYSKQ